MKKRRIKVDLIFHAKDDRPSFGKGKLSMKRWHVK